ncbi:uncharacterized protein Dana_GF24813 [Drosophila ananassae]|uniref:Uncharacterized protein n=1 Tax=Drosophila ananassae TaxID=7217 RepID=B3M7U2_DROAN|nr:uncharacterized protein LOC6507443 [Drosophila ananassae]EDV38815.1 uncharacterized protein Dana_GF24813 [Drosophila ananassae]
MDKNLDEVKASVQKKFNEIRAALHMREKLLLRQLEVIANTRQQQQLLKGSPGVEGQSGVQFVTGEDDGDEEKLLTAIRSFGHFLLDNSDMQLALQDYRSSGLRNEDYIEPLDDHETMYKCLQDGNVSYYDLDEDGAPPEAIVVDFSRNRSLVDDNAKRSIINITLQEAKELIRKAKIKRETYVPPLNLEELDDELESSIAEAVSSLGRESSAKSKSSSALEQHQQPPKSKSRKQRFKPKITINNCNGTINLRNIASLTINCASEEAVSAEIPLAKSADSSTTEPSNSTPTTTASSSNYSSNASSRSQSKKQKSSGGKKQERNTDPSSETTPTPGNASHRGCEETDIHDVTCDFYNRLLNEIKKSMVEKPRRTYHPVAAEPVRAAAADSSCDANSNPRRGQPKQEPVSTTSHTQSDATTGPQVQPGKRLILKNFENLRIILEANSGDEDSFHPVQIEQWLAEIISETDLEPMQNTDILEHSRIHSSDSP